MTWAGMMSLGTILMLSLQTFKSLLIMESFSTTRTFILNVLRHGRQIYKLFTCLNIYFNINHFLPYQRLTSDWLLSSPSRSSEVWSRPLSRLWCQHTIQTTARVSKGGWIQNTSYWQMAPGLLQTRVSSQSPRLWHLLWSMVSCCGLLQSDDSS